MKYYSTRDKNVSLSAAEAVKMGLSRDGGLLTPTRIPQIDRAFLERLIPMEYAQRAAKVMALYLTDYSEEELLTCLTLSIECTRYLSTTERTVSQHTTVLTSERNALSYALVDDVVAHLNALDGGEFVPNHLLQGFLHGGIAVILQL